MPSTFISSCSFWSFDPGDTNSTPEHELNVIWLINKNDIVINTTRLSICNMCNDDKSNVNKKKGQFSWSQQASCSGAQDLERGGQTVKKNGVKCPGLVVILKKDHHIKSKQLQFVVSFHRFSEHVLIPEVCSTSAIDLIILFVADAFV